MNNTEIVKTGMKAWESNDVQTMTELVADDFVLSGPTPQPLGKRIHWLDANTSRKYARFCIQCFQLRGAWRQCDCEGTYYMYAYWSSRSPMYAAYPSDRQKGCSARRSSNLYGEERKACSTLHGRASRRGHSWYACATRFSAPSRVISS